MPNGYFPQSQDDKDWKRETERVIKELLAKISVMQSQIDSLTRRR